MRAMEIWKRGAAKHCSHKRGTAKRSVLLIPKSEALSDRELFAAHVTRRFCMRMCVCVRVHIRAQYYVTEEHYRRGGWGGVGWGGGGTNEVAGRESQHSRTHM
jgi:hypothetical protein